MESPSGGLLEPAAGGDQGGGGSAALLLVKLILRGHATALSGADAGAATSSGPKQRSATPRSPPKRVLIPPPRVPVQRDWRTSASLLRHRAHAAKTQAAGEAERVRRLCQLYAPANAPTESLDSA